MELRIGAPRLGAPLPREPLAPVTAADNPASSPGRQFPDPPRLSPVRPLSRNDSSRPASAAPNTASSEASIGPEDTDNTQAGPSSPPTSPPPPKKCCQFTQRIHEQPGDLGRKAQFILRDEDSDNESSLSSEASEVSQYYDSDLSVENEYEDLNDVSENRESDDDNSSEIAENSEENVPVNLSDNQGKVNEILESEFEEKIIKKLLPPVSGKLAITMSRWLRETPKREKIKELFAELSELKPDNIEGLDPVRINEILYRKLPFKARVNDQRLRGMNTYFTRGIGPLIAILDKLIDFEGSLKSSDDKVVNRCSMSEIEIMNSVVDITGVLRLLHKSIQILSIGNAICLQKRKSSLKPYLDCRYHHLVLPNNPVTADLLGPHLEEKNSEFNRITEVGRKLYSKGKQFRKSNVKFPAQRKRQFTQQRKPYWQHNFQSKGNPQYFKKSQTWDRNKVRNDFRGRRNFSRFRQQNRQFNNQRGNFKQSNRRFTRK